MEHRLDFHCVRPETGPPELSQSLGNDLQVVRRIAFPAAMHLGQCVPANLRLHEQLTAAIAPVLDYIFEVNSSTRRPVD